MTGSPKATLWVVTRPSEAALPLVESLTTLGLRATALPCIERRSLGWPDWPAQWTTGTRYLLFITSPFAARELIAQWPRYAERAEQVGVAAVAPATAKALADAGVPVWVEAKGGALGLAQAVCASLAGGRGNVALLYPTSDAGEERAEQQKAVALLEQAAQVTRVTLYQTRPPQELPRQVALLPQEPLGWFFASPSAVEGLLAAAPEPALAPRLGRVVCLGRSTAEAYGAHRKDAWPEPELLPPGVDLAEWISRR